MGIKRKRSFESYSPSSSSISMASAHSGPVSPSPSWYSKDSMMEIDSIQPIASPVRQIQSWALDAVMDWNSRTRKRWRDNRPDEETIHSEKQSRVRDQATQANEECAESTIDKLFSAQRYKPDASPVMSSWTVPKDMAAKTQQATLHSFWNLPSQTITKSTFSSSCSSQHPGEILQCVDCNRELGIGRDTGMDADVPFANDDLTCHICRRTICDFCAVGYMELRRCLQCASH